MALDQCFQYSSQHPEIVDYFVPGMLMWTELTLVQKLTLPGKSNIFGVKEVCF